MAPIRKLSTQRLVALTAGLAAAIATGGAIAIAATGGGAEPPPKRLDAAVHDALSAPRVAGITARIRFTNHLIDSAGVQGASPILSGATGRLWASGDGRVRLELQSGDGGGGDAQALVDGRRLSVYEPASNTVYRATLPRPRAERRHRAGREAPAIGEIDRALARIATRVNLSGAEPGNVAGKPSYSVKVTPKDHGGLVGGARLAWDAAKGIPLRASVYAAGRTDPVVELEATDISYGRVAASAFSFVPPRGAKVVDLTQRAQRASAGAGKPKKTRPVTGVGAVSRTVGFRVAAPGRLAGRARARVRSIGSGDGAAALVTYGSGLGGVAVIESAAKSGHAKGAPRKEGQLSLPKVAINGARGQELRTALGTVIRFERDGVSYVVLGSVSPAAAEVAARGL
ncbi:MAG: LolA family protein [Thermoleophilaceae bacterium]